VPPRFSLVIPAYNESELLPRLLDSVEAARQRYRGGRGAIEVIVADNASTDDTARIAREAGCRVEPVARRCIASARNGGASVASGEVLCFVDADCLVHAETFSVIDDGLGDRVVAGSTGVVPERWTLGLRLTFLLLVGSLRLFGIDAGVVFCRRADFEQIGGYNEQRLFGEDVELLLAMRRLGRQRTPRQRLVRLHGATTITSNRKFDKHGQWHYFVEVMRFLVQRPFRPDFTDRFARRYWYDDR
jgi:glycosyltransferase involved in cell wall biosynthesis